MKRFAFPVLLILGLAAYVFINGRLGTCSTCVAITDGLGLTTLAVASPSDTPPVAASDKAINPRQVGEQAPSASIKNREGDTVALDAIIRGKPTVVVFYRGGWCPYCITQLEGLAAVQPALTAKGYQIIALSPDSPESIIAMAEKSRSPETAYTPYSDSAMEAARAFGVAFQVDEATYAQLQGYSIDLEKASEQTHRQLPVPSVFVINEAGEIVFVHADADYRNRLSTEALLEAAP